MIHNYYLSLFLERERVPRRICHGSWPPKIGAELSEQLDRIDSAMGTDECGSALSVAEKSGGQTDKVPHNATNDNNDIRTTTQIQCIIIIETNDGGANGRAKGCSPIL